VRSLRTEPRVRLPSEKAAISAASGASTSRAAAAVPFITCASPFTGAAASAIGSDPTSDGFVGSAAATGATEDACPFASIGALIPNVVVDAAHDWK
jgi:hypothetical protein